MGGGPAGSGARWAHRGRHPRKRQIPAPCVERRPAGRPPAGRSGRSRRRRPHHRQRGAGHRALRSVRTFLVEAEVPWGPTGSVGFELATGSPTASPDSDLDLLVRTPHLTSAVLSRLTALHDHFDRLDVRVDCQVETRTGAIALPELALHQPRRPGARLRSDPAWCSAPSQCDEPGLPVPRAGFPAAEHVGRRCPTVPPSPPSWMKPGPISRISACPRCSTARRH